MSFCVFATGEYICKLTLDIFEYASKRKVEVIPIQILASEATEVMCDNNPVSLHCCSEVNVNWSQIEWKQEGSISVPGEEKQRENTGKRLVKIEMQWVKEQMSGSWVFSRPQTVEEVLGLRPAPAKPC